MGRLQATVTDELHAAGGKLLFDGVKGGRGGTRLSTNGTELEDGSVRVGVSVPPGTADETRRAVSALADAKNAGFTKVQYEVRD